MSASSDLLVWIDCEMTGLDLDVDELVEIAVVITDYDLNPVDAGIDIVIRPNPSALEHMGEFVRNMHRTSGLLEEIPNGVSLADAEYRVLEYVLSHIPDEAKAPLAGNTIGTDRMFIAKYLPRLDAHLHYRNVDVSSIKELSRRWYPRAYFNAPTKHGGHRALADILESIRELRYYRKAVFVADPGHASSELQTLAAQVATEFDELVAALPSAPAIEVPEVR
ncbi:oligoribonuclease [Agromyces seonyuensis]|uniref:Oligoribonuclease n=1 Tax=Agromyces seonyuensis TaxID=2662446 RepID=A0A6I4NT54_9MICO|nr:oligoribonuclease [Agromyces seonyuensis]MWB97380.1 oligoribonuclease [Agromyces seonyuensis]